MSENNEYKIYCIKTFDSMAKYRLFSRIAVEFNEILEDGLEIDVTVPEFKDCPNCNGKIMLCEGAHGLEYFVNSH